MYAKVSIRELAALPSPASTSFLLLADGVSLLLLSDGVSFLILAGATGATVANAALANVSIREIPTIL